MERETLVEVILSVVAVGLFIAAIIGVGIQYGDGGLSDQGALTLIGSIIIFIFLMIGIGWWLSSQE